MNRIALVKGDITKLEVDAIVNAANTGLRGGGGVDGTIHREAGPELLKYNIQHFPQGIDYGDAVITPGFNLPARYIIHTVGPDCRRFKDQKICDELLAKAYYNSLKLAEKKGLKTIAFPNISTGVYGFPKERAAQIAIETVKDFLAGHSGIEKVIFVAFDEENKKIYERILGLKANEI